MPQVSRQVWRGGRGLEGEVSRARGRARVVVRNVKGRERTIWRRASFRVVWPTRGEGMLLTLETRMFARGW